ncbi:MAG TPA: helix-turn-helix domain-containing protein [Candidatus Sericytochromatia bacterium]|jgi:hypothetical protein
MPRPKPEKKITQAIRLLEAGTPVSEVADQLGVSMRTVQRWKNQSRFLLFEGSQIEEECHIEVLDSDDDFEKQEFRRGILNFKSASRLEKLIPIAMNQLEAVLINPDSRPADRLRACQIVGDWSGLAGGADGSLRRVFALGYDVVAPHNLDTNHLYEDAKVGRSRYAET